MASEKEKSTKASRKEKQSSAKTASAIKNVTSGILEEVEQTSNAVAGEVKAMFEGIVEKVTDVAASAAQTTASVADKVSIKDPTQLFWHLVDEIKDAGEASIRVIGDQFEALRDHVSSSTKPSPGSAAITKKKSAAKKKVTIKKKTAIKRKPTQKKKAAERKKTGVRKSGVKKKITASKKKMITKKSLAE